jgi:hypothetical protein
VSSGGKGAASDLRDLPRAAPRSRCTQAFGCNCDGRTTYVKAHALENAAPRGIRCKFTNASSPRNPLHNTRRVKQLALALALRFSDFAIF